ncbi:hypothetical protein AN642_02160, partial [Epulopiscium sp. SCG-B10WGA-EpuloA2]
MKPWEKFFEFGIEALSDIDLIAILLRTGTQGQNVEELSKFLLTDIDGEAHLETLKTLNYDKLKTIKGIGQVKALQLTAIFEIAKRLNAAKPNKKTNFKNPEDVANLFAEEFKNKSQEMFYALYLDVKLRLIKKQCISIGTLNATIVHARDVYKPAIELAANSLIVVHNHPSGDPEPSKQDIEITKDLQNVG